MPRRKFDTTQRGISDTHTDAPIATSICENKLVYAERIVPCEQRRTYRRVSWRKP